MIRLRWLSVFLCLGAAAAQTPKPGGDYSGMLGPLHGKLHLKADASGTLQCTLDSLEQGAMGLPCASVRLEANALTFDIPVVGGKWHGTVSDDGATLDGTWSGARTSRWYFTGMNHSSRPRSRRALTASGWGRSGADCEYRYR